MTFEEVMTDSSGTTPISVLGKVARLLKVLEKCDRTIGLSELASRAQLPKSTVYRLATEMAELGMLERFEKDYSLGGWLFELGQRVPLYQDMYDIALPFAEELFLRTGATVHLGIRDGSEVMYVLKIRGHQGENMVSRVAGRMPLHCTGTGRAILASEPEELLENCIANGLRRMTPYTVMAPDVLRQIVARGRGHGAGVEREEVRVGFGASACSIISAGKVVGAIGVTVRTGASDPSKYLGYARATADQLGQHLTRAA